MARTFRILEIDGGDADKREITLAIARSADRAFHGVAGAQAHFPDHLRLDVDIVRTGQVVRLRRTHEAEAIRQDFHHADADDLDIAFGQLLEDAEHQLLLGQQGGAFDLELFRHGQQFGRRFFLEVVEQHAFVLLVRFIGHGVYACVMWLSRSPRGVA